MKRHYFISDDLATLQTVERDLLASGITEPQVHVLSDDDTGVAIHQLHEVEAVLKKDVVHGTRRGALVGMALAAAILVLASLSGLTATYTGIPAIFLAIIVLGFCTWEGGLIGIQEPHEDFQRFQDDLRAGRHILFVDVDADQEEQVQGVVAHQQALRHAGDGEATPRWVVGAQNKWARFLQLAP